MIRYSQALGIRRSGILGGRVLRLFLAIILEINWVILDIWRHISFGIRSRTFSILLILKSPH